MKNGLCGVLVLFCGQLQTADRNEALDTLQAKKEPSNISVLAIAIKHPVRAVRLLRKKSSESLIVATREADETVEDDGLIRRVSSEISAKPEPKKELKGVLLRDVKPLSPEDVYYRVEHAARYDESSGTLNPVEEKLYVNKISAAKNVVEKVSRRKRIVNYDVFKHAMKHEIQQMTLSHLAQQKFAPMFYIDGTHYDAGKMSDADYLKSIPCDDLRMIEKNMRSAGYRLNNLRYKNFGFTSGISAMVYFWDKK